MAVFVLDKHKQPLMPCSEKRARLLLERGRAVVHKRYPFTIRLKGRLGGDTQPLRLGIDPGSKTTGLALMRDSDADDSRHVLCLFELMHRGLQIRQALTQRRAFTVPTGKKAGTYTGRVAVRKTGSFNIQTPERAVQGIAYRHCTLMQRSDGYGYHLTPSTQINGGAGHAIA